MQGSNEQADVGNRRVDTVREGEGETDSAGSADIYTRPRVKQTAHVELSSGLRDDLDGGWEAQVEGDT